MESAPFLVILSKAVEKLKKINVSHQIASETENNASDIEFYRGKVAAFDEVISILLDTVQFQNEREDSLVSKFRQDICEAVICMHKSPYDEFEF